MNCCATHSPRYWRSFASLPLELSLARLLKVMPPLRTASISAAQTGPAASGRLPNSMSTVYFKHKARLCAWYWSVNPPSGLYGT